MASCGFCEPELHGRICHNGIRHTRHAIGGSSNGYGKGYSNALHSSWHKTYMKEAISTFEKPS